MNKCTNGQMQDLLPDLEHGKLDAAVRQSVETHLAGCESCREDLQIIRTVKSAVVFAPTINVDSVVRQIPPYRMPLLPREAPARTRVVQWLVAATVGVLLVGGGTMLRSRQQDQSESSAITPQRVQVTSPESVALSPSVDVLPAPHTRALTLVADVRDLSDGNLQQLMDEMENFDGLPNSEPEPVFAVDTSELR